MTQVEALPGDRSDAAARRIWTFVSGMVFVGMLCIPLDFAVLLPAMRMAYVLALGAGCVGACFMATRSTRNAGFVLAFVAAAMLPSMLAGGATQAALIFPAQIAAGFFWARQAKMGAGMVFIITAIYGSAAIADGITGTHLYQSLFPGQIFIPDAQVFRARGIVGHPVPAAAVVMWVAAVSWRLGAPRGLARPVHMTVLAALVLGTLWATGTRSAILTLLAAAMLVGFRQVRTAQQVLRLGMAIVVAAVVGYVMLAQFDSSSAAGQPRIFQFDSSVTESDSYVVRANALEVLRSVQDPCGGPCVVSGHGKNALQTQLREGLAIRGQSTVDNWYVTLYWDFGLAGISIVVWIAIRALRRFWSGDKISSAGSLGVLLLLLSSAFYDAPYLSSGALLVGAFLSMLFLSDDVGRSMAVADVPAVPRGGYRQAQSSRGLHAEDLSRPERSATAPLTLSEGRGLGRSRRGFHHPDRL